MTKFIKVGNILFHVDHIIEVDCNYIASFRSDDVYVSIVTSATTVDGASFRSNFKHGTPEATALLSWLEGQTEVLS
jgi:hypothetical protein